MALMRYLSCKLPTRRTAIACIQLVSVEEVTPQSTERGHPRRKREKSEAMTFLES